MSGTVNQSSLSLRDINVSASCVGTASCLIAIFLAVVTKAFRRFVYRFYLYLASVGAWLCLGQFLLLFNQDKVFSYYMFHLSYGVLTCSLFILWISVYAFALVVKRKQIKREKAVFWAVVLVPLLLSWAAPVTRALNRGQAIIYYFLAIFAIFAIICIVSVVAFIAVIATLCKGAFIQKGVLVPGHFRKALREVLPVFVLITIAQGGGILMLLVISVLFFAQFDRTTTTVILSAFPLIFIAVPALLVTDLCCSYAGLLNRKRLAAKNQRAATEVCSQAPESMM